MNSRHRLPAPIKRTPGAGFADYTVTKRLPKILANAQQTVAAHGDFAAAEAMLQSILAGSEIDTAPLVPATPYWQQYLDSLEGRRWSDLPFFDLEFLFYHGLNSMAGFFTEGVDVFRSTRQAALVEAMPSLDAGLAQIWQLPEAEWLGAAIRHSLFANEADYSQMETSRRDATLWENRILLDQTDEFTAKLASPDQTAVVHIIADNAGHELCWDLIKIDVMLRLLPQVEVRLHVKPWPMFVSDALAVDVEDTLNRFGADSSEKLQAVGQRLRAAIATQQLHIQAETDWGEPRHFDELEPSLSGALSQAMGVIAKGDLNYRRFVQDRHWPPSTPVATAAAAVPFQALALRVLKSEATVGLPTAAVEQAAAERDDWQVCGYFAVVQVM